MYYTYVLSTALLVYNFWWAVIIGQYRMINDKRSLEYALQQEKEWDLIKPKDDDDDDDEEEEWSNEKLIINQEHHEYRAITYCIFAFDHATFYGLMSEKNWLIDLRIQFQTVSPDGLSRKGGFLPLDNCQLFHARTRQRGVRRRGGRGGDFPRLF